MKSELGLTTGFPLKISVKVDQKVPEIMTLVKQIFRITKTEKTYLKTNKILGKQIYFHHYAI